MLPNQSMGSVLIWMDAMLPLVFGVRFPFRDQSTGAASFCCLEPMYRVSLIPRMDGNGTQWQVTLIVDGGCKSVLQQLCLQSGLKSVLWCSV